MIHYQPKKQNPYILPKPIYYQTLWQIKSYFWLKEKVDDIIGASPVSDGMPKGTHVSDPTFSKASKILGYQHIINIIEEERNGIQKEYRNGVWRNIQYSERFPDDAHRVTYNRHKSKFVYNVAVRLGYY